MVQNGDCSRNLVAAAPWVAQEICKESVSDDTITLTKFSDVWAFGITILEVNIFIFETFVANQDGVRYAACQ